MQHIAKSICLLAVLVLILPSTGCKRVKTPAENNAKTDSTALTTITDTTTSVAATTDTATTETITSNNDASLPAAVTGAVVPPMGIKYGYLNSLELLSQMPETRAADKKLAEMQRSKEANFSALAQKYQDGMKNLQEKGQDMTRIEQESKMKEMAELEEKIQKMQMSGGDELAAEKERLYAPILAKADKHIKQIGKEQGYQYIFDAAALLYADTTKDILPLVKRKMGLK